MAHPVDFEGKVAVITGAGGGVGRQYALELAARGARVVVNDLGGATDGTGGSETAAAQVVAEIEKTGGVAVPNFDSVATLEGGQRIVDTAIERFGGCDILIANGGNLPWVSPCGKTNRLPQPGHEALASRVSDMEIVRELEARSDPFRRAVRKGTTKEQRRHVAHSPDQIL